VIDIEQLIMPQDYARISGDNFQKVSRLFGLYLEVGLSYNPLMNTRNKLVELFIIIGFLVWTLATSSFYLVLNVPTDKCLKACPAIQEQINLDPKD